MTSRETWHLTQDADGPTLRFAAYGDGFHADFFEVVHPGRTVLGLSYEQWRAMPPGPIVVVSEDGEPDRVEVPG